MATSPIRPYFSFAIMRFVNSVTAKLVASRTNAHPLPVYALLFVALYRWSDSLHLCTCRSAADAQGAQAEAAAGGQLEIERLTSALAASDERVTAAEQRVNVAEASAKQLRGQLEQYAAGWGDLQSQVEQLQGQNQQLQASLQVLTPADGLEPPRNIPCRHIRRTCHTSSQCAVTACLSSTCSNRSG